MGNHGLVIEFGHGFVRPQNARRPEEPPGGDGDLVGGGLGVQVGFPGAAFDGALGAVVGQDGVIDAVYRGVDGSVHRTQFK